MGVFMLFAVAWEDVRRPFWLHTLAAIVIWVGCNAGTKDSKKIVRILTRNLAYIYLLLKEMSFLTIPVWIFTSQSASSARIGYSAVLLTLLAGWDASPRDIRAAFAWGIISAARYTHLQAGTLAISHCLGWQAAGLVLIVLPRLPPIKALVNSLTRDFEDPRYESLQPVMIAAGCVSDALLLAVLFYTLPCMWLISTCGPNLPPQPSRTPPAITLQDLVCGTPPTTSVAVSALLAAPLTRTVDSVQAILAWLPCSLLHRLANMATTLSSWAAAVFIVVSPHRRQIACLIRMAQCCIFHQDVSHKDVSHKTLDIVPFHLVVYLGPVGALTIWTAILLATYVGFVHVMWQLLTWSTPALALGPWAGALYLGSLARQAWGWAPTLCWAASFLYTFDAVCQLRIKVASLQDRVHAVEGRETQLMGKVQTLEGKVTFLEDRLTYLEDRLKVAGLGSRAAVAGGSVPINIDASAAISADPAEDSAAPATTSAAAAVPAPPPPPAVYDAAAPLPPAVYNAAVTTPAAVRNAAAAPAALTPAAVDEAAALAPVAAAASVPVALLAAEGGDSTPAAGAGADSAAVPTPAGAGGGKAKEVGRMRRAYAAAKKRCKKLVPKMGRRQVPGQEAPQAQAKPPINQSDARHGSKPFGTPDWLHQSTHHLRTG